MTLASKIAKASKQVGGALKADARNMEQKYNYISADKVLTVCGQALADNGVAVFPAVVAEVVDVADRSNGKYRFDAAVTYHMTLMCDDGEPLVLPWVGRGSDYSVPDKALYKALTSGHKYFLMKLLNIGEGNEDGEHDVPQIDMAAIPEDTAGHLATPVQTNGNGHVAAYATMFADESIAFSEAATGMITKLREAARNSSKPMTAKQYGFLCSLVDGVAGDNMHGAVLSCVLGTDISSENMPGMGAKVLIDWLKSDNEATLAKTKAAVGEIAAKCRELA